MAHVVQPKHRQVNLIKLVAVPNLRCWDGEVNSFELTFVDITCHKITGTPHQHAVTGGEPTKKKLHPHLFKTQVQCHRPFA